MRFGRLGQLKHGYNAMTTRESDMLMDIGYQEMDENEIVEFEDPLQETAFVITTGDVEICWNGKKELMHRESLLDENPYCLHVPHGVKVVVKALKKSELLIQKTLNDRDLSRSSTVRKMSRLMFSAAAYGRARQNARSARSSITTMRRTPTWSTAKSS